MIIGDNKKEVIKNIEKAVDLQEFNQKVEVNDPQLTAEEKNKIVKRYLKNRNKLTFKTKTKIAKSTIALLTNILEKDTKIVGEENIRDIKGGAIITSNHFNPLDNLIIQKLAKKVLKKRLYIIGQETNLAMTGMVGFFMNYSDIIPISNQISYMKKEFPEVIKEILEKENLILIYPEQEMWFNYRKPRPLKEGAYYFAAKNNVPIVSCFVEMIETDEKDNEEFNKVKYILHILKPIYPNPNMTIKENSEFMMETDYNQKKEAYEKAYNKKLNYVFEINEDIAGLITQEEVESN